MCMFVHDYKAKYVEENENDRPEIKEVKRIVRESQKKLEREIHEILTRPREKDYEEVGYMDEEGNFIFTDEFIESFNKTMEEFSKLDLGVSKEIKDILNIN